MLLETLPLFPHELSGTFSFTHTQHTHTHNILLFMIKQLTFCGFNIILKLLRKDCSPPHSELTQTFLMAPGMLRGGLGLGYIHQMFELPFPCDPELLDYSSHTSTPGRHYLLPALLINPIASKVNLKKKERKNPNRFVCVFKKEHHVVSQGSRDQEGILTTSNKREPACLPDLFFKMSESLKKKNQ